MNRFYLCAMAAALALSGCASLDHHDRRVLANHGVPQPLFDKMSHLEPLTLDDIVELSRRGVSTPFILRYLSSTYMVYQLTSQDVRHLHRAGVDPEIVDYLLRTPGLYGPRGGYYGGYYGGPWYPYGPYGSPYYGYYPYGYPPIIVVGHGHWRH